MATIIVPQNAELNQVAQVKIPRLIEGRPIFKIMPIVNKDTSLVMWEQKDNYVGLQQLRGLGGQPARVNAVGLKQYQMRPGIYGEFMLIEEVELTERRAPGTFNQPIDVRDLTMEKQDQLLGRRLDRIEYIGWTLLTTGTFSIALPNGGVAHTDTFPIQTASFSDWTNHATATPLADLRSIQLLSRGQSVSFDAGSTGYLNRTWANHLLANTNAADLGGKRMEGLAQPLSLADVNKLLMGEGLPTIEVYDEGYLNDAGSFQLYIPNQKIVFVGRRPAGQPVANYIMTRNTQNPGFAPGAYMKVITKDQEVPLSIEVHDGHNGGPAIFFPGAVVVATA